MNNVKRAHLCPANKAIPPSEISDGFNEPGLSVQVWQVLQGRAQHWRTPTQNIVDNVNHSQGLSAPSWHFCSLTSGSTCIRGGRSALSTARIPTHSSLTCRRERLYVKRTVKQHTHLLSHCRVASSSAQPPAIYAHFSLCASIAVSTASARMVSVS